jgi:PBP1b-binding outer membrane lipoprotein LpoB
MKNKSLKALVIVATLLAGCSKESQTNETAATATNNTTAITNKSTQQQPPSTPNNSVSATTVPAQPAPTPAPKKKFEDMTALEVAQNPTEYGFEKICEMNNGTMSGRESYNADLSMVAGMNKQWVKKNSDGKTLVLTVHYDNDQPVFARWGGF